MSRNLRYYTVTANRDLIPDPYAWVDRVVPWAIFALGLIMWGIVLWRKFF